MLFLSAYIQLFIVLTTTDILIVPKYQVRYDKMLYSIIVRFRNRM